jgi:hypothetical protein
MWRRHSWNQPHNAHHFRMVTVQYRWHPHFNLTLAVRRETGQNREQLLCELPDGTLSLIPKWMTEAEACVGLSVGSPHVSVAALCRLQELLEALTRGRCGSPAGSDDSHAKTAG